MLNSTSGVVDEAKAKEHMVSGIGATMKTSLTRENFGKRFLGCANYRVSTNSKADSKFWVFLRIGCFWELEFLRFRGF
jgi:hypothetical protein